MSTKMSNLEFIRKLPKVELHAHINGSVSQETINKLIELRAKDVPESKLREWKDNSQIIKGEKRSLDECFTVFRLIHELVDSAEAVRQVTRDVVAEFAADNVKYLELRTTPRPLPGGLPRAAYVSAVLQGLQDADQAGLDVTVRLLLAIDRGQHSADDAADIVDLADNFRRESGGRVVGIDLSGNPETEDGRIYLPALEDARRRGLKLALHIAEVGGHNDESAALLALPPDRLGHGTFLLPEKGGNDTIMGLMEKHRVPIEACLTSNVCLQTVTDYADHHFGFWHQRKHPCIICTDDKGVFNTTLSEEYEQAQAAFGLSQQDLWQVSYDAISYIFESEQVKEELRSKWTSWKEAVAS